MKKATAWTGYSHATGKRLFDGSGFRSVLLYFPVISSVVCHLRAQPSIFSSSVPKTTLPPRFQLRTLLLPGSQGAAEHMFHVSAASSGKRIHSPTEFTCHLETYSGHCSNLWIYKSLHPTLRRPRTSMPCSDTTVLPKQMFFLGMLRFLSPAHTTSISCFCPGGSSVKGPFPEGQ